jgi:hypothetical protein
MSLLPLLLAQSGEAGRVGSGHIVGGWEFVTAAYVLTLLGILAYSASLWLRRRKE